MLTTYRIFKTKYSYAWFDGEGAFRYGGRWNTRGSRLLYTSGTLSLALLEVLVHLEKEEMVPKYSLATLTFDETLVADVREIGELPPDWSGPMLSTDVRQIGDEWSRSLQSLVLRVPSIIVPNEFNYLINVEHQAFEKVKLGDPEPFVFDKRLINREKGRP
ncbi:MAG: RES family NAD+ phosphorylase [Pyrinomonadaceae bacterium]